MTNGITTNKSTAGSNQAFKRWREELVWLKKYQLGKVPSVKSRISGRRLEYLSVKCCESRKLGLDELDQAKQYYRQESYAPQWPKSAMLAKNDPKETKRERRYTKQKPLAMKTAGNTGRKRNIAHTPKCTRTKVSNNRYKSKSVSETEWARKTNPTYPLFLESIINHSTNRTRSITRKYDKCNKRNGYSVEEIDEGFGDRSPKKGTISQ